MKKKTLIKTIAMGMTMAPLYAGDADALIPLSTPSSSSGDEWEFVFTPYGWAAGLDGTVGIGNATAEMDLSFSDILDDLQIGAMGHFEARKGRWAFLFDGLWLKLEDGADTPGPLFGGADVEVEELRLAGLLSYRVLEGPTTIDLLAGASYFSIEADLELVPGRLAGRKVGTSADWVDPVVGFHLRHELSEQWFTMLRGEIGGFGAGSDLTWQVMGGVGYRTSDTTSVFLGYRHLAIDYSKHDFVFDTETSGFILGVNFSF